MHRNEKMLREVPEDQELNLKGLGSVNSIKGLSQMLPMLSESAFKYHQSKGDFSKWMMQLFGDLDLGRQIREVRTKHFMKRQIDARLKELKRGNFNSKKL